MVTPTKRRAKDRDKAKAKGWCFMSLMLTKEQHIKLKILAAQKKESMADWVRHTIDECYEINRATRKHR